MEYRNVGRAENTARRQAKTYPVTLLPSYWHCSYRVDAQITYLVLSFRKEVACPLKNTRVVVKPTTDNESRHAILVMVAGRGGVPASSRKLHWEILDVSVENIASR